MKNSTGWLLIAVLAMASGQVVGLLAPNNLWRVTAFINWGVMFAAFVGAISNAKKGI